MKLKVILILFCLIANIVVAQDTLYVTQGESLMSLGQYNGYSIEIPQAKVKDVAGSWKKYIKRGETKTSMENTDGEYRIRGTVLSNISLLPMNVYAQIKETEKGVRITAFFTEDDSIFISDAGSTEKSSSVQKLMKDFALMQ